MSSKKRSAVARGAGASLPSGLVIGNKYPWKIGKLLGSGACGSVHMLQYEGKQGSSKGKPPRSYVIKLAPMPPPSSTSSTGGKKRKKTAMERNADLIHHEHILFSNKLIPLRGKHIPNIPEYNESYAPPTTGVLEEGSKAWRYLVMEQMGSSLAEWAPQIDGKRLSLGGMAQQMLSSLEQFHQLQYAYIDIKLDNFMVAGSATTLTFATMPKAVRLIDFGLVESMYDGGTSKHREDFYPNAPMVGTPLYASLNVLRGHSPSRRDDLEAMAYVLADLLLLSASKNPMSFSSLLPWRNGTSDEDILLLKEESLKNGSLFKMFQHAEDGKVLKKYLHHVQSLEYPKLPDYGVLHSLLGKLCGGGDFAGGTKVKTSDANEDTKRAKEDSSAPADSPGKRRKSPTGAAFSVEVASLVANGRAARASRRAAAASDAIDLTKSDSSSTIRRKCPRSVRDKENSNYNNNGNGVEPMDWDPTDSKPNIENEVAIDSDSSNVTVEAPPRRKGLQSTKGNSRAKAATPEPVLKLRFINGPGLDTTFDIAKGYITIIGRDPQGACGGKKRIHHATPFDKQLSKEHFKLEVNATTRNNTKSIKLTDLESTNGTFVNGKTVSKGGWKNVFVGDRIQVGESTLVVELAKHKENVPL
jgi:serine/threonine protein kinase